MVLASAGTASAATRELSGRAQRAVDRPRRRPAPGGRAELQGHAARGGRAGGGRARRRPAGTRGASDLAGELVARAAGCRAGRRAGASGRGVARARPASRRHPRRARGRADVHQPAGAAPRARGRGVGPRQGDRRSGVAVPGLAQARVCDLGRRDRRRARDQLRGGTARSGPGGRSDAPVLGGGALVQRGRSG